MSKTGHNTWYHLKINRREGGIHSEGASSTTVVDSMTFWYGSGSADPCLRLMDPDPAVCVNTSVSSDLTHGASS
jgi:hypothetical protein